MKLGYIYVMVSTDEQMRQAYSLIEQEERLRNIVKSTTLRLTVYFVKITLRKILTVLNGKR